MILRDEMFSKRCVWLGLRPFQYSVFIRNYLCFMIFEQ